MAEFSPVRHTRALSLFVRVMRLSRYSTENDKYFFDFSTFTTGISFVHLVDGESKASFICWLDANDQYGDKLADIEAYIDAEEKRFMEAENK